MSLPLIEISIPRGVPMGEFDGSIGTSVKIDGVELKDYVKRITLDVSAGDLVIVGLHIPARLKIEARGVLKPEWIVEEEVKPDQQVEEEETRT